MRYFDSSVLVKLYHLALKLGATEFCTFDHRQAALASLAGLTIVS